MPRERILIAYLIIICGLLLATSRHPFDRLTWFMEVAPVLIVLPVLLATRRRFPLTPLLYFLIFLHALILIMGGTYTYARVPLGFWVRDLLHLGRNNYDRLGHFFQGFVPALAVREILLRLNYVSNRRMASFLAVSVAMAVSAWYELIEWAAAVVLGQQATDFLGSQGDPWDTQWDMFMCFIGSLVALLVLSGKQNRQIAEL